MLGETYITQRKDRQCGHSVRQHAITKDLDMPTTLPKIPQKVAQSKRLEHSAQSRVFPNSFLPVLSPAYLLPLLIEENHIKRQSADYDTLKERHNMHIPINPRAVVESIVFVGDEKAGEERGHDGTDPGVESKGEEDFVDVERESWEGERFR